MSTSEEINLLSAANKRQFDAIIQINKDIKLVQSDLRVYLALPFEYRDLSFSGKYIKYADKNLQECTRLVRIQMYDSQLSEFYKRAIAQAGIPSINSSHNIAFEALNHTQMRITRIEKILGIDADGNI